MRWLASTVVCLTLTAAATTAEELKVFQDLEEVTSRIPRLKDKPHEKLIAPDGTVQPERLIFKDVEHGTEIWALTFGLYTELANIERRTAWNCDGSLVGFIGNRVWRRPDGTLSTSTWAGNNYLMTADGSLRKKLVIDGPQGQTGIVLANKFNLWDARDPRALYYAAVRDGDTWRSWSHSKPDVDEMWLVRVRVRDDLTGTMEPIYRFPNTRRKTLQNISDDNKLLIQDVNAGLDRATGKPEYMPNFYVIDLNRKPGSDGFARSHPLAYGITDVEGHDPDNEHHVHGITISRDGTRVAWNYGPSTSVGEYVGFSVPADDLDACPVARLKKTDRWGQYQSHTGTFRDGRNAYFSGTTKRMADQGVRKHWGLFVRFPGQVPIPVGRNAAGGHVTWCGNDPDWFFANTTRRLDNPRVWPLEMGGKIVAGKADGSVLKILCDPYDRKRGGKSSYASIPRPNQSPDATKCWYHSSMLMPSDEYTGSYVAVFRRPHAPTALTLAGGRIHWSPHAVSGEVKSYVIYRRDGETWTLAAAVPATADGWKPDTPGTYMLTGLEHSGLQSDTSSPTIEVPSGKIGAAISSWDRTAPAPPDGLKATREAPGQYRLTWPPPDDDDVRYLNLYASQTGKPQPVQGRRFASLPKDTREYLDWSAPLAGPMYYAITAVDRQGNESVPTHTNVPPD